MGAFLFLVMIVGLAWLSGPTNATAHDSRHRPPMPPPGMLNDDHNDTHIEVYQTSDGHWHYDVKRKNEPIFSLGWFLLGVVLALILIALL